MPSKRQRRNGQVSPKKALAKAIRELGADATHEDLVRFTNERFGLNLHFVIIAPKTVGNTKLSPKRRKAG
jgi:hypothetical protein